MGVPIEPQAHAGAPRPTPTHPNPPQQGSPLPSRQTPRSHRAPRPQAPKAPLHPVCPDLTWGRRRGAGGGGGARGRSRSCPRRAGLDSPRFPASASPKDGAGLCAADVGCPSPARPGGKGAVGTRPVSSPPGGREGTMAEGTRWARKRLLGRFLPQEGPCPAAQPGSAPPPDPARPPRAGGWDPHRAGCPGSCPGFCPFPSPRESRWGPRVGGCTPKPSRHQERGKEQPEMAGSRWEGKWGRENEERSPNHPEKRRREDRGRGQPPSPSPTLFPASGWTRDSTPAAEKQTPKTASLIVK